MTLTVEIAKVVDDEVVAAFNTLIPQLSSSNPSPTREQLQKIVSSDATFLLLAKLDGRIVGSLTLALFQIPTGLRAWIEDVVVDSSARFRDSLIANVFNASPTPAPRAEPSTTTSSIQARNPVGI